MVDCFESTIKFVTVFQYRYHSYRLIVLIRLTVTSCSVFSSKFNIKFKVQYDFLDHRFDKDQYLCPFVHIALDLHSVQEHCTRVTNNHDQKVHC